MPSTNLTFAHAPFPGVKCRVVIPEHFDASAAFIVCVFLHGRTVPGTPFEDHITAAADQMDSAALNAILVAPRFDNVVHAGGFESPVGFSQFIDDLRSVLPPLLQTGGMAAADAARVGAYAATKARLAIVAFSGGWRPLNGILDGLLSDDGSALGCTDRVVAIQLLDSIYPGTSSGVVAWQQQKRQQSALLSIYGRNTGDHARPANIELIGTLKTMGAVQVLANAAALTALPAGAVSFLEVATQHLSIPGGGPPDKPIATVLDLLADRLPGFPMV